MRGNHGWLCGDGGELASDYTVRVGEGGESVAGVLAIVGGGRVLGPDESQKGEWEESGELHLAAVGGDYVESVDVVC